MTENSVQGLMEPCLIRFNENPDEQRISCPLIRADRNYHLNASFPSIQRIVRFRKEEKPSNQK